MSLTWYKTSNSNFELIVETLSNLASSNVFKGIYSCLDYYHINRDHESHVDWGYNG